MCILNIQRVDVDGKWKLIKANRYVSSEGPIWKLNVTLHYAYKTLQKSDRWIVIEYFYAFIQAINLIPIYVLFCQYTFMSDSELCSRGSIGLFKN